MKMPLLIKIVKKKIVKIDLVKKEVYPKCILYLKILIE